MVEIRDLEFSYPNERQLILLPELVIQKGEKIFLFGPSGSGKTTFLEILAGIQRFSSGNVIVGGAQLGTLSSSELDVWRAKTIGFIFQSFNLIPSLNVLENVLLALSWYREITTTDRDQARELLRRLGLAEKINSRVYELSLGQQQRVAAARALLKKPQVLLADEPTSSLDYDHREEFLKILFELCQGIHATLLFVSHDRTLATLFDRQIEWHRINKGGIR